MHQIAPSLAQPDPAAYFGRRHFVPRRVHRQTRNAAPVPPFRPVFAIPCGHQQAVTPHQIIEHARCTVIPCGDPLQRVPAEHDHDFRLRTEILARLGGDVDVQSAVRHRRRELRMLPHQRFQHSAALIEPGTLEFLVRKRTRQHPQDFVNFAQRRLCDIDMRDRRRIPCSRKQRYPFRSRPAAMNEFDCQLTFVIHTNNSPGRNRTGVPIRIH